MTYDVIQLADWRVRKIADSLGVDFRRQPGECAHLNMAMVEDGQFVRCEDCKAQLAPYWVLGRMLAAYRESWEDIEHKREQHRRSVMADITLSAALAVQKAWRKRRMVPCCPHCFRGIFAADGFGDSMVSKDFELEQRRKTPPMRHAGARSADVIALYEAEQLADDLPDLREVTP